MLSKVYRFKKKNRLIFHEESGEIVESADYFQYYTTGTNKVVNKYSDRLFSSTRYENERHEVLAYDLLGNENFADVLLALNQENFIFDGYYDYDTMEIIADKRMHYLSKLMRKEFTDEEYSNYRKKIKEELDYHNENQKYFIAPIWGEHEFIMRKIKEYFKSRTLNEDKD